jgi:HlyD family secretion protein
MPVPDQLHFISEPASRVAERWRSTSRARRRIVAGGAGLCVVLVAATSVVAADDDPAAGLRTSEVTTRSVDQVLEGVATVEPVSQASVAFPVAGTVESVSVSVGEEVTTGQELAHLSTTDLERDLREADAQLDQADLTLERALNGESVGGGAGGTGAEGGAEGGAMPTGGQSSAETTATAVNASWSTESSVQAVQVAAGPSDADISAAQQAVLAAQQQVDAAQATADAAVANAASLCAAVATADADGFQAALDACSGALTAATSAQQSVTAAQQQVDSAAAALDALLDQRAAALAEQTPSTTTPQAEGGDQAAPSTGGSGMPDSGSGALGATSSGVSSAQLIALQQDLDVAVLGVFAAQQALEQATIVSPVDGTIAAVQMAAGDEVEAASATANILVVTDSGFEVTFSVSVDDLTDVEVGQQAEVLPDGHRDPLEGEVVAIGQPGEGSSYPVTVGLSGDTSSLGNGSVASVEVVTSAADETLAVPTSAVLVEGDRSTVQVVDGDEVRDIEVETGAVGSTWVEILDGLEAGQEVVLADLDEPLPGTATDVESTNQSNTFGGGAGGGGLPPFAPGG